MSDTTDNPAPADLWSDLRAGVHRYVARRVRDSHAAEDVTQDVMLKVGASLAASASASPESPSPAGEIERLDAWVMAIARNAVIDHYRARRDRATRDEAAAAGVAPADEPADAIAELSSCVRKMIDHLDPASADALRLVDLENVSQQALADRMGISLSGAKSRVQRARAKLSAMILDCCDLERNRQGGVVDYQTTPRSPRYCGGGGSEPPGDSCGPKANNPATKLTNGHDA
jgi:RNA polymerase sigma-70 factor (ECF subfamily)